MATPPNKDSEKFRTGAPLPRSLLHRACDPDQFTFKTTDELEDVHGMVGQSRATKAVEFGVEMEHFGFNLYVMGPPGTGRHSFISRYLTQKASESSVASDWCYVNNFDLPRNPKALKLPAGRGRELRQDIIKLIEEANTTIPAAFESEEYRSQRAAIEKEFQEEQNRLLQYVQQHARERGFGAVLTPGGLIFAPLRDGEVMPPEEFRELPEAERKRIEEETGKLSEELGQSMQEIPRIARKFREKVRMLDRQVAMLTAGSLIDDLVADYGEFSEVADHLKSIQVDMIENVALFLPRPDQEEMLERMDRPPLGLLHPQETPAQRRYGVNVMVDRGRDEGAPLIFEDHPVYQNLIGEVEYVAQMGTMLTDFSLVRAGALHRANGGFLVLDAHKVLSEPFSWQALKQALRAKEIRIESIARAYSFLTTTSLEPKPIPLDVKIVLIGDRRLYYLLQALDPEFLELFKVAADFDDRMDRNEENNHLFAQLIGTVARREGLLPIDRDGVARLIEESARHAGDAEKLSAQVRRAADIMREANYWTKRNGQQAVGAKEIEAAIDSRIHRASRIREGMQEEVQRGTILIDSEGEKVGQVNGLAVIQVGDFAFARPNRITARVALGSGKVIDIEREAELGGPIHSKGVLILSGYLAGQYGSENPLSLTASIVLEQSYGGVEGDSASSVELYALLSALAEAPIRQSLAVTGSVNQYGEIQAIGGVNEKIEGFFDICNARGLTGDQGVVIPAANVKHLMLRSEVLEAAEAGKFHVYPVATIGEGISILTGVPPGERDEAGKFPEDSINGRVEARLIDFASKRKAFGASGEEKKSD